MHVISLPDSVDLLVVDSDIIVCLFSIIIETYNDLRGLEFSSLSGLKLLVCDKRLIREVGKKLLVIKYNYLSFEFITVFFNLSYIVIIGIPKNITQVF